ncbi:Rieske 2Fe-2S domain-containing protein [Chloroflexi bacterium TSY]|nr:Rieske 2Fe-2S domain-containing protein [Chloroflexi bacterium TSY]
MPLAIKSPDDLKPRHSQTPNFVNVAEFAELETNQCLTVHANGHVIALFMHQEQVYAVDNRCPHMGFPLDKGTVQDGILTCHWHHARFDLASGGTFDQFADDVRAFPVEVRGENGNRQIWVDVGAIVDERTRQRDRLLVGLERDIPLVLGKAALVLMDQGGDPVEPFRAGVLFGSRFRIGGWGQGLTMHVCLMNMQPYLEESERPRAMFHGLSAVARDSVGHPPRFTVRPLPDKEPSMSTEQYIATLKRWFRQFIEVRDAEGAERCIVSAIRAGATAEQMADMLFAAVTDHRYIDVGHPADFTNKAFEALDIVGWDDAEILLTSLVSGYANAARMEESNAWRYPIDLISILGDTFTQLDDIVNSAQGLASWQGKHALVPILLADDPQATVDSLLEALRAGASMVDLAETVTYAAALRVAQFHTSNEFGDWDTALHTFTFSNAILRGLKRAPSVELLRGVFDAAMSIYLDRFLNIPTARLPEPRSNGNGAHQTSSEILSALPNLLDEQQRVNQSARLVADYLYDEGEPEALLALLGKLLLREDRDFHTIQCVEAAIQMYKTLEGMPEATNVLVSAIRYLAAHSPTVRAQGQTYQIAYRLHIGDNLFEEDGGGSELGLHF